MDDFETSDIVILIRRLLDDFHRHLWAHLQLFSVSYLVDLLSCVDKTIWKQFKDVLKMFFVHWVVYV